MIEKYRYRGRLAERPGRPAGPWEYFDAYSDQDALAEFRHLTGLARNNGGEVQTWDEDLHCWMNIDW